MKATAIIFTLFFSITSNAQIDLSGQWFALDANESTPLGFNFKPKGELDIYEFNRNSDDAYTRLDGHYYYEDGNDILVTITWYNEAAKTTEYTFEINPKGELLLNQTYPEKFSVVYERESNIVLK